MNQSILGSLGLPQAFGITLLGLALVLSLAPYLKGTDFGIFRVPDFPEAVRKRLKVIGPFALAAAIALHVPLPQLLLSYNPTHCFKPRTANLRPLLQVSVVN